MKREAIGDGAVGAAGQRLLTISLGRTRLAETLKARGDAAMAAARDGAGESRRDEAAAATRP
jgi:hypothetical protein